MPTICALGGGGGGGKNGMKFISQETQPTDPEYLDGSWAWYKIPAEGSSEQARLYFYTGGQWRAVNTYQ